VASASVAPLDDGEPGSPVTADLRESDDRLQLDLPLSDAGLPTAGADFYEVWLIDPNVEGMISLGPVRSDGTYSVPTDVDYRDFPIVDVSVEPADGNPTHSGVSVLRGTLAS
jgi:anti-sigma-K factor RskA